MKESVPDEQLQAGLVEFAGLGLQVELPQLQNRKGVLNGEYLMK